MLSKLVRRAVFVIAAMTALLVVTAGQAQAANTYLILSDVDGRQLGAMTHIDAEPDRFKVCDTQRDGDKVTGFIYEYYPEVLLDWVSDGSDSGCNTMKVNLVDGVKYRMYLCWNGPGFPCTDVVFRE